MRQAGAPSSGARRAPRGRSAFAWGARLLAASLAIGAGVAGAAAAMDPAGAAAAMDPAGAAAAMDPAGAAAAMDPAGAAAAPLRTPGLVRLPGAHLVVAAPRELAARPEIAALAAALDRAAAEMAPRLGVEITRPLRVEVAPDYTEEGRLTGRVGAAVPAVPGVDADLVLVPAPEDLFAYRYAIAQALLAKGVVAAPPALLRGSALWASGGWYGRPYRGWLPLLAAARALPTAAELLAGEPPADGSELLSTPVAAAVVERLPGATAAAKLARPPSPAAVSASLTALGAALGAALAADLARAPVAAAPPAAASRAPLPFLRGVSLAMQNSLDGGYHAPALAASLDRLRRLGADAVSLMPFAFEEARDRPRLAFVHRRPEGESDVGLVHAARLAHARGMRVLWKPHVWVSGDGWPGEVRMATEADWAAWWASYRRYVLHHAFLARWAGAELFSVGCELSRTTARAAEWRELIAAVRVLFPGAVTYASNWGPDLEQVSFWDRLDYVGVDAYDPLAASPAARRADLARGAAAVAGRLAALARRTGRQILLTEVGFAARRGAWVAPAEEGGDYSEDDQAAAYEALLGALGRPPWLAGAFVWKAFSGGEERWGQRPDFRFLGRKAETVIGRYYRMP